MQFTNLALTLNGAGIFIGGIYLAWKFRGNVGGKRGIFIRSLHEIRSSPRTSFPNRNVVPVYYVHHDGPH